MTIDGDTLEIELDMDIKDVLELKNFIVDRLEYIEAVSLIGEMNEFSSSSLLQLLFSIKKSKPSITINAIDTDLKLENYGVIHWVNND
ncbi:hypothetical protein HUE87_06030 [Candidatus Sulfurimonas marisnigri]|uniref:STAS domain-containing protein n=1 Tax=Candidatus Sulfurimonas marisnigri TaxID=2740405 RepID=A0A7S7M2D0_9BACT|nr:hypothetical protein [Candidatus Sulfurimonas marisnigri]QOY55779.1 hypothetical protein HUE87_06030 [Candidatus Sulfurimonas marisnigri]